MLNLFLYHSSIIIKEKTSKKDFFEIIKKGTKYSIQYQNIIINIIMAIIIIIKPKICKNTAYKFNEIYMVIMTNIMQY